jgi:16S rRNA (uracil1498-N3)-methyltransferase
LSITDLPVDVEELTIVVGPEGGISAAELEQLSGAGFEPRRLGDSILRTSTAGPAAIAAILTQLQIW